MCLCAVLLQCHYHWVKTHLQLEITNQLCEAESYSRGHQLCSYSIVYQHFMEHEGSIQRSQELYTCTYREPNQLSPHHPILSL
jgi:hypothetical protein